VKIIERTTNETARRIDCDRPCMMFDKKCDDVVVCWDRTDDGALLKLNCKGPRFSAPLIMMTEIEQKCFEKFFPGHNKIAITEGVNKGLVGYFKIEQEVKHNGT